MSRAATTGVLVLLCLSACGSSSSSPSSLATDAGAVADAQGPAQSVACDDPKARPEMPCGTLAWTTSETKTRKRNHHATLSATTSAGTFLYALGGFEGSTSLANVDRFTLSTDGKISASVDEPALPAAVGGLTGAVASNVIVLAGGMSSGSVSDNSYTAVIHDDGSLGEWKVAGSVKHQRFHAGAFANQSTVYVLGGFDASNVWDDALMANVQPDGTLSEWTSAGKLMGPRSHFSVSLVDGFVFIAGGLDKREISSPVPALPDVSRARIADDGTLVEWTPMTPLPNGISTHASFFYGGYLYVAGGISGGTQLKEEKHVWRAPIDADHSLGAWEAVASLPVARGHVHQLPVFSGRVYSVAGALDFDLNSSDAIQVGAFE